MDATARVSAQSQPQSEAPSAAAFTTAPQPPPSRPHEWPGLAAWRAKGRDLRLRWGPGPDAAGPLRMPHHEAPTLESAMALVLTSEPSAAAPAASASASEEVPAAPPPGSVAPDPHHPLQYSPMPPQLGGGSGGGSASGGGSGSALAPLPLPLPGSLVEAGLLVLRTASPAAKAAFTHAAWGAYLEGRLPLRPGAQRRQAQEPQPRPKAQDAIVMAARAGTAAAAAATARSSDGDAAGSVAAAGALGQPHPQQQEQEDAERDEERMALEALTQEALAAQLPDHPARPERPRLVRPKEITGHESSPMGLNGYMLHNLAHIELNAIDLAWDTVVRFAPLGLPDQLYEDFARVADDESRHLGWCLQRLGELGHSYGDMDAHDLLWQGCRLSAVDLGARLAVVPMSQEARGLDAGTRLVGRLVGFGDVRSAAVVALIAEEERAHVAVGVTWFTRLCGALGMRPDSLYRQWLLHLNPDLLKGPFNHSERSRVGLAREWYDPTAWPEEKEQEEEQGRQGQEQGREQRAEGAARVGQAAEGPSPPPPPPPPRRQQPRRPTRGSPHPRLEGPPPRLTPAQLRQLAERLAVFSGLEEERAAGGALPSPPAPPPVPVPVAARRLTAAPLTAAVAASASPPGALPSFLLH